MAETFKNIKFLTEKENSVMWHLHAAQNLFSELCADEPQDSSDTYNFGHYVDAAKSAVLLRGARRMDPDALLPKKPEDPLTITNPLMDGTIPIVYCGGHNTGDPVMHQYETTSTATTEDVIPDDAEEGD